MIGEAKKYLGIDLLKENISDEEKVIALLKKKDRTQLENKILTQASEYLEYFQKLN